jgi:hypothetical protein
MSRTSLARIASLLCVSVAAVSIGSVAYGRPSAPAAGALVVKLKAKHGSGVSGTATLTPVGKGFRVALRVKSRFRGALPAHIHTGPCRIEPTFADPRIWNSLNDVVNGKSVTTIKTTTWKTLRAETFSINVHAPSYTVVACGDIPPRVVSHTQGERA